MSDDPKKKENAEKEIAYLTKNKERMRYAEFVSFRQGCVI